MVSRNLDLQYDYLPECKLKFGNPQEYLASIVIYLQKPHASSSKIIQRVLLKFPLCT